LNEESSERNSQIFEEVVKNLKLRRDEFGNLIIKKSLLNPVPEPGVDFVEGDPDDDDSIDLDSSQPKEDRDTRAKKRS